MVHFSQIEFYFPNFSYAATEKPRASAKNIGIKVSELLPSWLLFTTIVLPVL